MFYIYSRFHDAGNDLFGEVKEFMLAALEKLKKYCAGGPAPEARICCKMLRLTSRIPFIKNNLGNFLRNFHTASLCRLREIVVEQKDDKTTVVDCKVVKSPREPYLLKLEKEGDKCPLCRLQLNLQHTDVLILCQYIDSKGNIMKHKDTSLCREQYKLVKELIYMAQYAGLLPEPPSDKPKKPYQLLNTYYDESTIKLRYRSTDNRNLRLYYLKDKLGPIQKFRIDPKKGIYCK